jgi:hypothetical protein
MCDRSQLKPSPWDEILFMEVASRMDDDMDEVISLTSQLVQEYGSAENAMTALRNGMVKMKKGHNDISDEDVFWWSFVRQS